MNIPSKLWSTIIGLCSILTILAIVLIVKEGKAIFYVGSSPTPNTITVNGSGDAYAAPDVATFTFTVQDTEKSVADAQTKVTTKASSTLEVVRAAGIEDKDIQTQSYNISPHYESQGSSCTYNVSMSIICPSGKSVLTGYDVSETIQVKLRDLTKAGALLTSLGSAGVDNLNGPSFQVDNPDSVQAEARAKAIDDAQAKAQVLANQLGVSLKSITNFSESTGGYPQPMMYAMSTGSAINKAVDVPEIAAGQQKVTDNVSITYEIR